MLGFYLQGFYLLYSPITMPSGVNWCPTNYPQQEKAKSYNLPVRLVSFLLFHFFKVILTQNDEEQDGKESHCNECISVRVHPVKVVSLMGLSLIFAYYNGLSNRLLVLVYL